MCWERPQDVVDPPVSNASRGQFGCGNFSDRPNCNEDDEEDEEEEGDYSDEEEPESDREIDLYAEEEEKEKPKETAKPTAAVTATPAGSAAPVPHQFKPGTVALREIRRSFPHTAPILIGCAPIFLTIHLRFLLLSMRRARDDSKPAFD